MKTFISLTAAWVVLVASPSQVAAQTIPPACEQYITAIKVCGAALVKVTELTSPADAPKVRASVDVKPAEDDFRSAIKLKGADVVAQMCATSPAKEKLQGAVVNVVTLLGFSGGVSDDCLEAYNALR